MSHTLTMKEKRIGSGEPEGAEEVPPQTLPPFLITTEAPCVSSRRSVWTVPGLLGAMVLVAVLSVLGTLWLTGQANRPQSATLIATSLEAPVRPLTSRSVVSAATKPSDENRKTLAQSTPMTPPPVAPAVVPPAPTKLTVLNPAVQKRTRSKRRRHRRSKRSRPPKDSDEDDKPAVVAPSYSLYATLGAASGGPAPRPVSPAASKSGGVTLEIAPKPRPHKAADETVRMLQVVVNREGRKPAADATLPVRIPVAAVTRAVRRIQGSVQACLRRFGFGHATLRLRLTVSGTSGRVITAAALGRFGGSPAGSCAQRSVRNLRFPRFSRRSQTVLLPIRSR